MAMQRSVKEQKDLTSQTPGCTIRLDQACREKSVRTEAHTKANSPTHKSEA